MRTITLLLFPLIAGATSIPCMSVGPVTFTNCQTVNTASPGLPLMGFNWVPDAFPDALFPGEVVLTVPGQYILNPASGPQFVRETLTADFQAPGYTVTRVMLLGTAFDESDVTSENIFLTGPCSATLHGQGVGVGCTPPPGTSAGTLSVTLDIHSDACTSEPCHSGIVYVSNIGLVLQQAPEPGTWGFIVGGILLFAAFNCAVNSSTRFCAASRSLTVSESSARRASE